MELAVRIHDDDGGELTAALHKWLLRDRAQLDGATITTIAASPPAGSMGAGLEIVNVVLSNTIALASLITSIAVWRDSHRQTWRELPTVEISWHGRDVLVLSADPEQVDVLVKVLAPDSTGLGAEVG